MTHGVQTLHAYEQHVMPAGSPDVSTVQENEWYWRPLTLLFGFWLFAGVMMVCFEQVHHYLDQPIREVRVVGGQRYLDQAQLAQHVAAAISAPLLAQDMVLLQDRAQEDPWVRQAQVRRVWPPAIEVVVEEQRPVARWGKKGLLNHQGDIFWPKHPENYTALPQLDGPATETQLLMAQYHDLSRLFQSTGLKMTALALERRGAWRIQLDNGIDVIVGREDTQSRLRRFIYLYQSRFAQIAGRIKQIDMRYTNGAAVSWLPEPDEVVVKEAR